MKKIRVAWNKGLTKETDIRVARCGKTQSITKKKKFKNKELEPWNKGLTKETDERVREIASKYPKNRKIPKLSKKIREAKRKKWAGKNNPRYNPNKTDFEIYKKLCHFEFNLGNYPSEFCIKKIKFMFHPIKNKEGYTRDHKYSISEAFWNQIPPEYIKHPANCQLILHRINSKKNKKSDINFKQLENRIRKWNKKYE